MFILKCEVKTLLVALQAVVGVLERRSTMPAFSYIVLQIENQQLKVTATDREVELSCIKSLTEVHQNAQIALPGRKLYDICRALPEDEELSCTVDEKLSASLRCQRSRFTLIAMLSEQVPLFNENEETESSVPVFSCEIPENFLREQIEKTYFSMAQQDVRSYLNGLFFEVSDQAMFCVASDGHRLALYSAESSNLSCHQVMRFILPRKAVQELRRLLSDSNDLIKISVSKNDIRVHFSNLAFASRLLEGQIPDYKNIIPKKGQYTAFFHKETLKQLLHRVSILSNEKHRGVRFQLTKNNLSVTARNPAQEAAEESMEIDYNGIAMTLGLNAVYLLEALNSIDEENLVIIFTDTISAVFVEGAENKQYCYIIMPMQV